ncbi:cytochrome C oxidase Cbb3 [Adlercreutzia sp. ZJ141]|uniref:cytochrome C oxidase Cbb3 n=1 Tax=Adlercreutzia sp. ZJ141 TaxID=2709406 RepID=UPI0013E9A0D0|nr:cytochrome C oxidase Cbb3 [Adlercreutzia sp. ZJ141]
MPTVRQNISYYAEEYADRYGAGTSRVLKHLAIVVLAALLLEVFVFNMNYFISAQYNTISLHDRISLDTASDGTFKLTEADNVMEFSGLNTEVHNVKVDFYAPQSAKVVNLKIQFTDEAHKTYFDSTEYTVGIPIAQVSTKSDESEYINIQASGLVDSLRIEVVGEDVSYPIKVEDVSINAHCPFRFNVLRFFAAAGILLLAGLFRPRGAIYRIGIVEHARLSKAVITAVAAVEIVLGAAFLLFGSNLVGVATSSYNYGSWDGVSIVNTFEVGGDNAQQYAELAKSFANGKLYLEEEPPQWLQDMDEPYDRGARAELEKQTGEQYLFDVAYYEGKYYVYFGVVPVLLFYLPFYLLTGANFPTAIGVLITFIAFVLGCTALLDRFARYHFKHVSLGLYLLLQIPLVACCGFLYLLKFPTFYSLPIAVGLAFSVWGLYCWMRGRAHECPGGWYFAGSLCMALVAGCRPQLLVLSFLAFPLFWRRYITKGRLFTRRGFFEFMCLIAPYFIVGVGIMWYNWARFGSVTDFGANYNLTVNDMTKRGWNMGRFLPAAFAYFLQPPCATGVFPFLQPVVFETTYMGQTIKEVTFGGIFACLPILWVLLFSRSILRMRFAQRATRTVAGVIIALIVGGVVVALADAQMAGILQRYYADFSFMFLAAAVLLVFVANEGMKPGSQLHNQLMKGLLLLVALSVTYVILMCFVAETGWYSSVYAWAYQDILEAIMFWT